MVGRGCPKHLVTGRCTGRGTGAPAPPISAGTDNKAQQLTARDASLRAGPAGRTGGLQREQPHSGQVRPAGPHDGPSRRLRMCKQLPSIPQWLRDTEPTPRTHQRILTNVPLERGVRDKQQAAQPRLPVPGCGASAPRPQGGPVTSALGAAGQGPPLPEKQGDGAECVCLPQRGQGRPSKKTGPGRAPGRLLSESTALRGGHPGRPGFTRTEKRLRQQ